MSFWKKLGVSLMLIMIIGLGFQDVSKDPDRTSIVWQHFILDKEKERAKCKHCGKEFKFLKGSSTKGLLKHLKETKVHSDLKLNNDTQVGESESTKESNETENSKVSVKKYFPSNKKTVQQIVTDLAISGASFNFIAKCETLKKSFRDNGYEMPDSPTTVQKYVLAVAKERTAKLIEEVKLNKSNGTRLALSLDEYTAKNNRKYLGMNIHQNNGVFFNLGLQRIHGSMPSEKLGTLVEESLAKFDLNIKQDFISVTNDAASVMVKWARNLPCIGLKCIVHGIHLSVTDKLYVKKKKESNTTLPTQSATEEYCSDDDDDCDDINGSVEFTQHPEKKGKTPMIQKYDPLLTKVRKENRKYRKSQVRNDELQEFIENKIGKKLAVLNDCKTR